MLLSLHESEVETKSKQPFLSKSIGTPFIKEVVEFEKDIGLEGSMDSFDIKFPLPSLIAICAPE